MHLSKLQNSLPLRRQQLQQLRIHPTMFEKVLLAQEQIPDVYDLCKSSSVPYLLRSLLLRVHPQVLQWLLREPLRRLRV